MALTVSALAVSAAPAFAAPVQCSDFTCTAPIGGGDTSGSSTAAFLGLQWSFGSNSPQLTGGVRWLHSGDDDSVYGLKVDASVPLNAEFLPTLRLLGVYGSETVQGEFGGGYDFARDAFILSAGAQVPHVNFAINFGLDGYVEPIVGINSLAKPDFGSAAVTCPADYVDYEVAGGSGTYTTEISGIGTVLVDDKYVASGHVCVQVVV